MWLLKKIKNEIKIITGCPCFGENDPMNGSCYDCYCDNPELNKKRKIKIWETIMQQDEQIISL